MEPSTINALVQGGALGLLVLVLWSLKPLIQGMVDASKDALKRSADSIERMEALLAKHEVDDERRNKEVQDTVTREAEATRGVVRNSRLPSSPSI
jgi:hypothetical protein